MMHPTRSAAQWSHHLLFMGNINLHNMLHRREMERDMCERGKKTSGCDVSDVLPFTPVNDEL